MFSMRATAFSLSGIFDDDILCDMNWETVHTCWPLYLIFDTLYLKDGISNYDIDETIFLIIVIAIRNPYIPADSKDPSMDQMKQRKLVCSIDF